MSANLRPTRNQANAVVMSKSRQKCTQCGSTFEVDTTRRNWPHVKICSDDCRKARAAAGKRKKYKSKKIAPKNCKNCGNIFQPAQNIGARQKYCSRKCHNDAKRKKAHAKWADERRVKHCSHCGNEFVPKKFAAGKQIYCSKDCQVRAIHKRHSGKYHRSGNYQQEFKVMKPAVLDRDKVCVLCGSEHNPHIHHWDNSGQSKNCNNSLDNLAVLCGDCHSAIHKVTLARVEGKWCLDGRIFAVIDVDDPIPILKKAGRK